MRPGSVLARSTICSQAASAGLPVSFPILSAQDAAQASSRSLRFSTRVTQELKVVKSTQPVTRRIPARVSMPTDSLRRRASKRSLLAVSASLPRVAWVVGRKEARKRRTHGPTDVPKLPITRVRVGGYSILWTEGAQPLVGGCGLGGQLLVGDVLRFEQSEQGVPEQPVIVAVVEPPFELVQVGVEVP